MMSDWKEKRTDWTNFDQAIRQVEEELGVSQAEADALLCRAVGEGKIGSINEGPISRSQKASRPLPDEVAQRRYDPDAAPTLKMPRPLGRVEVWIHIPEERRWFKVDRTDLRSWLDEPAQQAVGKRPRIKSHLAKLYPDGVPDPAFCPRKELRAELLKTDPRLTPLDEATLKTAIDEYNRSIRTDPN
jgi:hypothetical protein